MGLPAQLGRSQWTTENRAHPLPRGGTDLMGPLREWRPNHAGPEKSHRLSNQREHVARAGSFKITLRAIYVFLDLRLQLFDRRKLAFIAEPM